MNIAKLTDWALRLDHPPWTASKGRGKQRFRRILTPLDISCRCCPYRCNECHLSRYKFFGRVYPKVMPKRCILEDLCEGNGEILRTRCERRLRTKGERLMQYRNAYHEERFRKILESGKWEDRTMLFWNESETEMALRSEAGDGRMNSWHFVIWRTDKRPLCGT